MSTPQLDDDKLQRYFDGELAESEADEIRRAIEDSEQEQARLQQLERLRELMRMAADDSAVELGSDELYSRVRDGIDRQKRAGFGEGLRAIDGAKDSEARPARRRGAWVAAGTALAAAAAVALVLLNRSPEKQPQVATTETPAQKSTEKATSPSKVEIEAPGGSEVVEVDFGRNTGTVFEVQGEAGEPIAVVWINDEEGP